MDAFLADVVAIERQIVTSLVDAGCRYVHIDAPGFTAYIDPPVARADARTRRGSNAELRSIAQGGSGSHRQLSRRHLRHSSLPRQSTQHVAPRRRLRCHRRAAVQRASARPLSARIRHAARRQLRAAAFRAEGQGGRARPRQHQDAGTRNGRSCSSGGSKRRANIFRSTSSPSRRNAALLPTLSATCSAPDDQKRKLERVVETARAVWG